MQYRRLGLTGMQVSAISLGAWLTYGSEAVAFDTAQECIRVAIENGINFIDIANVYSNGKAEETVGKVVQSYDRSKLVISTKAYFPMSDDVNDRGLSRKNIFQSVHQSLKRLQMDYLDIFFCHRYDTTTRTDETVRAIEDLIRQGKLLYWGTSMWDGQQIEEAWAAAEKFGAYAPVVEQPVYNMLDRAQLESEQEEVLSNRGMGTVVFSPLAGGLLTGKYDKGMPKDSRAAKATEDWMKESFSEHRIEKARELGVLAKEIGVTLPALALAWVINHPNVDSAIIGASKPKQIVDNLKALDVALTPEIEERIEAVLQNKPYNSNRTIPDASELRLR
jgi:voltage-dependent potassium channel beta subunit